MATEAKKDLRARYKHIVTILSNEHVLKQSEIAQNVIMGLEQYQRASRIGIYLSMPSGEAQTDRLVRDALRQGKEVFVPVIHSQAKTTPAQAKRKVMDMLRLNTIDEYLHLAKDSWGIPKLSKDTLDARDNAMGGRGLRAGSVSIEENGTGDESQGLDLIVMPGVAFDRQMNRMGHGAAFYDTFLERFWRQNLQAKPYLVGLCLAEQVLPVGEELVTQDWDRKVDAVATGNGELLTSRAS